jgi:hypothetical protein
MPGPGYTRLLLPAICNGWRRTISSIRQELATKRATLRDKLHKAGQHARTPAIVADLLLGVGFFLDFPKRAEP